MSSFVSHASGSIDPGVYLIRNVQFGTVVNISNGDWNDSKIQVVRLGAPANIDPNDQVNQRFIIFPNAQYPEAVNIFSLRAGAYITYAPRGRGSISRIWQYTGVSSNWDSQNIDATIVRGRSTCAQDKACLWIPEEAPSYHGRKLVYRQDLKRASNVQSVATKYRYRFRPFNDKDRLLEAGDGHNAAVLASPAKGPGGDLSQHWALEKTDMDRDGTADWMSQIFPQSTKFSMMSIPGTHQSVALRPLPVSDNPRCQNRGPYLQVCDGIRLLDLRLDLYSYFECSPDGKTRATKPSLISRHGTRPVFSAWEGYSFSAIVQSLACFLHHHRGETVFVNVRMETSGGGSPQEWVRSFYEELEPYASYFSYLADSRTFADISLDDVRGTAVIFCDSVCDANPVVDDLGNYKSPVNNVDIFFRSNAKLHESTSNASGAINTAQWEAHGKKLSANIVAAGEDKHSSRVFRTEMNSSGLPGISGAPMGFVYNPIDFCNWLRQNWVPRELDGDLHPKGVRMGVITFDFYELLLDFVKFIIERNNGVSLDADTV